MSKYQTFCLFDIDNTLLKTSRSHIAAFSKAFKKVYKINTTIDIINYHGMTDQQIIIEVLKKNNLNQRFIESKIKDCMGLMAEFFIKTLEGEAVIALDGVKKLLSTLQKNNIIMGLVTGNLEQIARAKLKKVGLNYHFKIGGFGSDDIDRTNLVKLVVKRANDQHGLILNNNIFLFGDAPQDMRAAKTAGIKAVGVATGIYSKSKLKEAGADIVLDDLINTESVLSQLIN